jgi:hypothetical protein
MTASARTPVLPEAAAERALSALLRRSRVVAIALANKMARSVWAMLSKGENYRGSALAPA